MKRAIALMCLSTCIAAEAAATEYEVLLKSAHGTFLSESGGMNNSATAPGYTERFTLVDRNGGSLQSGDPIALRNADGNYLIADPNGSLGFQYPWIGAWESFTLAGLHGATDIHSGTGVALQNAHGKYLIADPNGAVGAPYPWIGAHEQWSLFILASSNTGNSETRDERSDSFCFDAGPHSRIVLKTDRSALSWQADGNLVLYDRNHCAGHDRLWCTSAAARWTSGTHHQGQSLCFSEDGNFGIKGHAGQWLWRSNSEGAAFKTRLGKYLRAENGGGSGLRADAPNNQIHERFDLISNADGTVSLRTHNGQFVAAEDHGEANADRGYNYGWESFHVADNGDGTHSIYSPSHETYLRAVNGGGENARFDVPHNLGDERYTMLIADKLVLENCTVSVRNSEEALWSAGYDCSVLGDPAPKGPAAFSQNAGNNNFGSGLTAQVGYQTPVPGYTRAFGMASAYGRIFGRKLTIIAAKGEAVTSFGQHSADAELEILGVTQSVNLPDADNPIDLLPPVERTFFEKKKTFMAGPIPLTVTGTVTGTLGMQGYGTPGATGFTATVRPYTNLSASISVGVGVACVSAGIRGTLTLLEVGFPATVSLDVAARTVDLGASIDLETLSGSVELYAEACLVSESWELGSWDGIDDEWALFPTQTFHF